VVLGKLVGVRLKAGPTDSIQAAKIFPKQEEGHLSKRTTGTPLMNTFDKKGDDECWLWTGSIGRSGYGVAHLKNHKTMCAHRYIYQKFKEIIPAGLELDHLCRNKKCVNPNHLEPVTHSENMKRSTPYSARGISSLCSKGHILDGIRRQSDGWRYCKTCVKLNKRKQRMNFLLRRDGDHCGID
jgi:hypothetical protein